MLDRICAKRNDVLQTPLRSIQIIHENEKLTQNVILEFAQDYIINSKLKSSKIISNKISAITTASSKANKSKIN